MVRRSVPLIKSAHPDPCCLRSIGCPIVPVGRELGARFTDTELNLVITTRRGRYPKSVVKLSKASISNSHVAETVKHSIISRDLGKTLGLITPCEVSPELHSLKVFLGSAGTHSVRRG